jgi:hypothetical protein
MEEPISDENFNIKDKSMGSNIASDISNLIANSTSNLFDGNACGYGCTFATELIGITTMPSTLFLDNYDLSSYSLKATAMLVDYYGNIVNSESGNIVEAFVESQYDGSCSINNNKIALVGAVLAEVVKGTAYFRSFSAICIPGGSLNVTFRTTVRSFSSEYPQYIIGKKVGRNSVSTKITKSKSRINLRPCR